MNFNGNICTLQPYETEENDTDMSKPVIVEFECFKKDIEDVPGFDHHSEQTNDLLKTKVATVLADGFRYVNVKSVSNQSTAQRLSELEEKVKGLYNEDDPKDYKDAIFDVLNTMSELTEEQ